jgi:small subunit ribosomal protein S3
VGQKAHPYGLRLGIIKTWKSKWFSARNFADLLQEDLLIRRYVNKRLEHAGIADVEIIRNPKKVTIDVHTARPGIVIGRKGAEVDNLKGELELLTGKEILLNVIEVKKPEISASLVGQSIAKQLEGRVSFRRAMKKAMAAAMKSGAEGIKICCGGRLGGAEIARTEKYHDGRVPLHTLRADIDYAQATANTTYGTIGVKVWICQGEKGPDTQFESEVAREAALGLEEKPAESRRRRARHKKQPDAIAGPGGERIKPSAKALDKSHRRPQKWTGPRRDDRNKPPSNQQGGGKS